MLVSGYQTPAAGVRNPVQGYDRPGQYLPAGSGAPGVAAQRGGVDL